MYGWEPRVLLKHYLEQGLSKTAIAERLHLSRRTIHYWLASGQLERDLTVRSIHYPPRSSKLDPYHAIIRVRLDTSPELTAVRLFDEVRAAGYPGSLTQLKVFVRRVRPQPPQEPVVRFETPPGHQAQVDFAEVRLPWGKRFALMVVLGYSRLLWVQFYPRQTMLTLMRGLEEAFGYFGGVPAEFLFDQLKAVIIEDHRPEGGRVLENPEFLRFAAHWDFRIRACRPSRAQTKGEGRAPDPLRPPEFPLRPHLHRRRRPQCLGSPMARHDRQCPDPWDHPRGAAGALRAPGAGGAEAPRLAVLPLARPPARVYTAAPRRAERPPRRGRAPALAAYAELTGGGV